MARREAESGEAWAGAVGHYEQALALDATLSAAQEGLARARERERLDQRLEATLAGRERLASDVAAWVDPPLLSQLGLAVGDPLRIGVRDFTITGVVARDGGRASAGFSIAAFSITRNGSGA